MDIVENALIAKGFRVRHTPVADGSTEYVATKRVRTPRALKVLVLVCNAYFTFAAIRGTGSTESALGMAVLSLLCIAAALVPVCKMRFWFPRSNESTYLGSIHLPASSVVAVYRLKDLDEDVARATNAVRDACDRLQVHSMTDATFDALREGRDC